MKKINLGCGKDIRLGYVNVDIRAAAGVDLVWDITKKLPFKAGSFDEALANDILEHLIFRDQEKFLSEVNRILKQEGKLTVRTPNIEAIWERMADDAETRNLFLYGEAEEQGVWGAHKTGHSLLSIGTLFRECGFKIDKYKNSDTNWEFNLVKAKTGEVDVLVTNKAGDLILNMGKKPVVWQINKPVKNYWWYWFLKFGVDEYWVKDEITYKSLFPLTKIPMARVKIDALEYQKRRAYARKLAKIDLGI